MEIIENLKIMMNKMLKELRVQVHVNVLKKIIY